MRKISGVVVAALLAVLCACSSGGKPAEKPSAVYVHTMRKFADPNASDAVLLTVGHAVCHAFADGKPWGGVVAGLTQGGSMRPVLAGEFIATAAHTLCPQYSDKLPN